MVSRLFAQSWDVLDYSTPTAFIGDVAEPSSALSSDDAPKSKKRKTSTAASTSTHMAHSKGHVAPGGTGYSGAAVEDVRGLSFRASTALADSNLLSPAIGSAEGARAPAGARYEARLTLKAGARVSAEPPARGGRQDKRLPSAPDNSHQRPPALQHGSESTPQERLWVFAALCRCLHVRRPSLLDCSAALTDMTTRSELYFEVFDWLFVRSAGDMSPHATAG